MKKKRLRTTSLLSASESSLSSLCRVCFRFAMVDGVAYAALIGDRRRKFSIRTPKMMIGAASGSDLRPKVDPWPATSP